MLHEARVCGTLQEVVHTRLGGRIDALPVAAAHEQHDRRPLARAVAQRAASLERLSPGQLGVHEHEIGRIAVLEGRDALVAVERAMYAAMQRHLAEGDREAAVRAFIEPWNDATWTDLPAGFRARLAEQAPAIVAETLATGAAEIADSIHAATR